MKGEIMPGFTCTADDCATTETTLESECSKKRCNPDLERKDGAKRDFEPALSDRRVRSKLQDSELSADSVRKNDVSRTIRPMGGKDRHSKVNTSKGPRDRRVRLSVSTAIQFYDVQDRLGYDQPSKAVEWLMKKAKTAIDELPPLPTHAVHCSNHTMSSVLSPSGSSTVRLSAQGVAGPLLTSVGRVSETAAVADASVPGLKSFLATSGVGKPGNESRLATQQSTLGSASFFMRTASPNQADNARNYTTGEFPRPMDAQAGSPSARIELRTKARERARERAKEKHSVKEPAKASCSTLPPSSAVHDPLSQHTSITESADQKNIVQSSPHDHTQEFQPQPSLENQMQSSFKDALRNFVNNATPEQMQILSLQVPRQTAANSSLLSPSTALLQEAVIQGFHQKSQMLPNFLNQVPLQSWSQSTTEYSHGLHCSSRGSICPSSFFHNNVAFCHTNSPLSVSCSSAISQFAVLGVPISNFAGAIMPSDRVPTPSIISVDPSQSAFRPTTQLQLPASHQERALLDYLSFQRLSEAQLSSYGLKTSDILLNSQANGVAQLAPSSAFEPCNNQFHRTPSSRTSSDLQNYDHGVLGLRNSETLQSDQRLPARLRGLDEIEEQLKRSSSAGNSAYHVVYPRHD